MMAFEEIRKQIAARHVFLSRRIQSIETEPDFRSSIGRSEVDDALSQLTRMLHDRQHELALVESSLRRIDNRSYDCCIHCGSIIPIERLRSLPYTESCDSCSKGFEFDYFQRIRIQHRGFRSALHSIEKLLTTAAESSSQDDERRTARAFARIMLPDLSHELEAHFELEERGGYLADALAVAPRFSTKADLLQSEHRDLLSQIERLAERVCEAEAKAEEWMDIQRAFSELAEQLLHHERGENKILNAAFPDDLGSAD
jgi:RNA polymerase-binding transcription factor DksA